MTNDLYKRTLISSNERKVIFNPPKLFTKSEINKALSSINKEMEEISQELYINNKNNNYEL